MLNPKNLLKLCLGWCALSVAPTGVIAAEPVANDRPTLHIFSDSAIPVDIRLNKGELTSRYKIVTDAAGKTTTSQLEDKIVMDVTVLILKDGRIKLNFMGATGSNFRGSFSPIDAGPTGTNDFDFNLKRMSLTFSPLAGMDVAMHDLELTAGSFGPENGVGSEDTNFDDDGYIMGYRAKVSVSSKGYLAVTGGYVGDFETPNVFDRLDRMGEYNYLQVLLNHSIGAIAVASFDYTRWEKTDYVRGAIKVDFSKWTKFIDSLVVEDLMRFNSETKSKDEMANIFAAKVNKKFKALLPGSRDLSLTLAYIYNDKDMSFPNADRTFVGNQMRVSVSVPNLKKFKHGTLAWFIQYLQSLDDYDQFRLETGLSLIF